MGIDFFPELTLPDLSAVLNLHYDYFILDFGILNQYTQTEFFRSFGQIIIGYASPWKIKEYYDFYELYFLNQPKYKKLENQKKIILLGNQGTKEHLKHAKHHYHLSLTAFPYLENPFQLTSLYWNFFEKILEKF